MDQPVMGDYKIIECNFCDSLLTLNTPCSGKFQRVLESSWGEINIICKIVLDPNLESVTLKLKKDCKQPAMATIKFQLNSHNMEKCNVSYWEEEYSIEEIFLLTLTQSCLLSGNCSRESHKSRERHQFRIDASCQIIWYGLVDDFYSPNSGRVFTRYSDKMKFYDMKIKVGRKYYPAHKIIVASQSSVLMKTLEVNMKESNENCIDLTEFGVDVVKELLLFLYENRIDEAYDDEDLLLKLLQVGDMYDIPDLKKCCGMLLSNMLTEENVLMLLENGYLYRSSVLKIRAIAYIIIDERELLDGSDFKELGLRHPELPIEICSMIKFFLD